MKLEEIKFLSKEKRFAMLVCMVILIRADGRTPDNEIDAFKFVNESILGLGVDDVERALASEGFVDTLDEMTGEELYHLGTILGFVASSDGKVDRKEIETVKNILTVGRLNPDLISEILNGMKAKR
jgi:uncharacterized tellurite resistance protein B-like protein